MIFPDHFVVAEWRQHRLRITRQALTEITTVALRGFPRRLHIIRYDGTRYIVRLDGQAALRARDALLLMLRRHGDRRTP